VKYVVRLCPKHQPVAKTMSSTLNTRFLIMFLLNSPNSYALIHCPQHEFIAGFFLRPTPATAQRVSGSNQINLRTRN
jgi:hypothetical protein